MKANLTYKIIIINLSGKVETSRRVLMMLLFVGRTDELTNAPGSE